MCVRRYKTWDSCPRNTGKTRRFSEILWHLFGCSVGNKPRLAVAEAGRLWNYQVYRQGYWMKTVWRVFAYLRRYPVLGISMLACAITSTSMIIVAPLLARRVINEVINGNHRELLLPLLFVAAVAFILQNGLNSLRLLINNTFEQKVIFDLRSDLYSHIQLLPLRWFDNRATGDLMTRLLEDVTAVERVLIDGIEQGLTALLQIVVVFAIMCYVSFKLTLIALSPALFLAAGALCYTLTAHRRYRLQRRAASAMNALLHDNLSGIRQIRSFAREDDEHRRFNRASDELRRSTL